MKLGEIANSVANLGSPLAKNNVNDVVNGDSFSDVLKSALGDVNANQVKAYEAMEGIATGKVENLQEAVRQIEEAELSLKLGLEVKNKALSAYKEVMRMQV